MSAKITSHCIVPCSLFRSAIVLYFVLSQSCVNFMCFVIFCHLLSGTYMSCVMGINNAPSVPQYKTSLQAMLAFKDVLYCGTEGVYNSGICSTNVRDLYQCLGLARV